MSYIEPHMKEFDKDLLTYALHENDAEDADIWFRNWMMIESKEKLPMSRFMIEQGKESIVTMDANVTNQIEA